LSYADDLITLCDDIFAAFTTSSSIDNHENIVDVVPEFLSNDDNSIQKSASLPSPEDSSRTSSNDSYFSDFFEAHDPLSFDDFDCIEYDKNKPFSLKEVERKFVDQCFLRDKELNTCLEESSWSQNNRFCFYMHKFEFILRAEALWSLRFGYQANDDKYGKEDTSMQKCTNSQEGGKMKLPEISMNNTEFPQLRKAETCIKRLSMTNLKEHEIKTKSSPIERFFSKIRSTSHFFSHQDKSSEENEIEREKRFLSSSILLLFELYHTIPGIAIIFLYCASYLSFFELVSTCLYDSTRNIGNQNFLYASILIISTMILRITGGIWSWASYDENNYYIHKQAMKTRVSWFRRIKSNDRFRKLKLGQSKRLQRNIWERWLAMDNKVLAWFHFHAKTKLFFNLLAFSLLFLGVCHFMNNIISSSINIRESVLKDLPSAHFSTKYPRVHESNFITDRFLANDNIPSYCMDEDGYAKKVEEYNFQEFDNYFADLNNDYNKHSSEIGNCFTKPQIRFEELNCGLFKADDEYLKNRLTSLSYEYFVGYGGASLFDYKRFMVFHSINFIICILLITKLGALFGVYG